MHPVHGPEAPPQGLLLARAVALQPVDLDPERPDLALEAPDLALEPRDLALLLGETPLDLLELGQERGLPVAGARRFLPLLTQELLRLLELALLALDRVLAPGLGAGRDRERRDDQERGEADAAHGSRPVRASQPPSAPRS
ncbi:MAG: hypothetical protein HW381_1778, partial [Candidatus Rokubacteria bacterium]|nr:hypothetical protein [Candidatus Rokubacteria bacterium]